MFKKGDRVHSIKPVGEKRITGAIGIVVMQPQPPTLLVRFETNIGGWAYQGILNHWWCYPKELAKNHSPMEQETSMITSNRS